MGIDVVTLALAKGYTDGKIRDADFGEVPLDTSLTKKGQAADAKAVGDAISKLSGGNVDFRTDETLTLKDGVLSVNTTNDMEQDNTLPITSAGVFATVGNIEALLKTI